MYHVNYFEGFPIISYNQQVTLSISIPSPWNCHLRKEYNQLAWMLEPQSRLSKGEQELPSKQVTLT